MSGHDETSSRTLVAGSDEDFDVICDPCNSEGQRVQATGHCVDCNENMCISCMKFHRKLAVVKDHVIKDKSTLSQSQKSRTKVNRSAEDTDPMTDRCPKHPDELIKFYCNSHCKLGCSDCISLDHRPCKDILYIKEVSGGVANSDELIKLQIDIQMLVARITSIQNRNKGIKQTVNDSYSQTVSDIRNLKREIIGMLDQLLEKASIIKEEEGQSLDSNVSVCESAIRDSEELFADIEKKKVKGNNNQLFITMKNSQSRILELADETEKACNKSNYEHFSFQPDEQLSNLLSRLTSLGEVLLVSQPTYVRAEYQHDINIKSDKDTKDCRMSRIIVLPDGRLALSDEVNMSVKLVSGTKGKVTEQIKLDAMPIDLKTITAGSIAVTLAKKLYIQVFSVSPVLSESHSIAVSSFYYGIEYIPDKLILVCRDPTSAVHICDMSGAVLQQITTDYGGNKLFTQASRIAISPDRGVMYVSDVNEHTVVCLTIDGKLIRKYASESLKCPVGIAFDDNGYAYVCSYDTKTIHQLSPSGTLDKVLLGDKDGIVRPFSIGYRAGHLFIVSGGKAEYRNITMVYRLDK